MQRNERTGQDTPRLGDQPQLLERCSRRDSQASEVGCTRWVRRSMARTLEGHRRLFVSHPTGNQRKTIDGNGPCEYSPRPQLG